MNKIKLLTTLAYAVSSLGVTLGQAPAPQAAHTKTYGWQEISPEHKAYKCKAMANLPNGPTILEDLKSLAGSPALSANIANAWLSRGDSATALGIRRAYALLAADRKDQAYNPSRQDRLDLYKTLSQDTDFPKGYDGSSSALPSLMTKADANTVLKRFEIDVPETTVFREATPSSKMFASAVAEDQPLDWGDTEGKTRAAVEGLELSATFLSLIDETGITEPGTLNVQGTWYNGKTQAQKALYLQKIAAVRKLAKISAQRFGNKLTSCIALNIAKILTQSGTSTDTASRILHHAWNGTPDMAIKANWDDEGLNKADQEMGQGLYDEVCKNIANLLLARDYTQDLPVLGGNAATEKFDHTAGGDAQNRSSAATDLFDVLAEATNPAGQPDTEIIAFAKNIRKTVATFTKA